MRCSVVFGVTLRHLVLNISSSSVAINTAAYCCSDVSQLARRWLSPTGDPVDNTLPVAALIAGNRLRIAINAHPPAFDAAVRGGEVPVGILLFMPFGIGKLE